MTSPKTATRLAMRTCVGCRQREPQSDLLRVVAVGAELVPDDRVRQPGRGAYLHPRAECLLLAERRRSFARALRVAGPLSTEVVTQHVQECESIARTVTVQRSGD